MKEIIDRLHERRQIEQAKSILEAAGYTVTNESSDRVQGIADYGTKTADEFSKIQMNDPRIEELVSELGLEDVIWPEDENQEVPDEAYKKVLRAYHAEKSQSTNEAVKEDKSEEAIDDSGSIPEGIKKKCLGFDFFNKENSFSEQEIEMYREEFSDYADALGISLDDLLLCAEDDEFFKYFRELQRDSEEVRRIIAVPGVYAGLYKSPDGISFVWKSEFGYQSVYFPK